jgi:alkane 1-monooxygenase
MKFKVIFLLGFIAPLSTFISIYFASTLSWFGLVMAFLIVPLLDLVIGDDKLVSFTESKSLYYDLVLYLQVPLQFGLLYFYLYTISTESLIFIDQLFLVVAMGINCGVGGINTAHELGHRSKKSEIIMAKALLCSSLYYQFYIDHNKGHHKHVSTPDDPSSARKNESVYSFVIRSVIGTFKSAWHIDSSDMKRGLVLEFTLLVIVTICFGTVGLLFFILSAIIGFILLECVNYIEHYGLERKKNDSGRYEKVMPHHSWNSNHLIGRGMLFNLSRHSDHHFRVDRKYQRLENHKSNPNLPTGYPGTILLSLVPSLWFSIMNKRISKHLDTL